MLKKNISVVILILIIFSLASFFAVESYSPKDIDNINRGNSTSVTVNPSSFTHDYNKVSSPQSETVTLSFLPSSISNYTIKTTYNSPNGNLPVFLGDSEQCQSLNAPCSWVSSSTYGLGYRQTHPQLPEFSDQSVYKIIPANDKEDSIGINLSNFSDDTTIKLSIKENMLKTTVEKIKTLDLIFTAIPYY